MSIVDFFEFRKADKSGADNPMAMVPQMVILKMAFFMLEPPVLAEVAPKMPRKTIVNP